MALPLKKNLSFSPQQISELININYTKLIGAFYESQSNFLSGIYRRYNSIETANIILCFARNVHLEIIRQREKDLNFNVSLEKFWENFNLITKSSYKITNVVENTGIPKETVRRKIKQLINTGFLIKDKKNNAYSWALSKQEKSQYFKIINEEIKGLAFFINKIINLLNIKIDSRTVEQEIESQFSFYWYHYLSCQIEWLKWWQLKFKDNELLLIALQVTIPSLNCISKNIGEVNLKNVFEKIGMVSCIEKSAVSATSIHEITGIPRATCIRKLDKLSKLGFLNQLKDSKRYSINQTTNERTKHILSPDNVTFTINNFSSYISIILNSLLYSKFKS